MKPMLQIKTPLFSLRPTAYPSSYQPQHKLLAKPAMLTASLLHWRGPCTAPQCQGHRRGCPLAFLIDNSSDAHTAMGNSGAVHSEASFDTHSSSFWQLNLNFGFTPSGALEGESTWNIIREQERPKYDQHGAAESQQDVLHI